MLYRIFAASFLLALLPLSQAFGERSHVPQLLSETGMKGTLETAAKDMALLSVGDSVTVNIDPSLVMPGDRLGIFEVIKSQQSDDEGNRLVFPVGRLVVTEVFSELVVGKVEYAKKEIFAGSYVDFHLPARIYVNRYIDFLKTLVAARLDDPVIGSIKTALIDVTDETGNIRRIDDAVYSELNEAVCTRPQFSCIPREDLDGFLKENEISTSRSLGRYMMGSLSEKFGADIFISAKAIHDGERVQIILSAYDMKKNLKTRDMEITALAEDYKIPFGTADDIVVENDNARHGYLKLTYGKPDFLSGRRVDYLFTENLEGYIYKKHLGSLTENLSDDVDLGKVTVRINGKILSEGKKGVLFDGIIRAGEYDIKISALPTLKVDADAVIGRPIETTTKIKIPADAPVQTEIILKTYGRQAIIIIDTKPVKERSAGIFAKP